MLSTQQDTGVPLVHAPDGVGYRLMELPPELLQLLESDDPPTLTLQSSANSAVLKTGTQSWSLRQKNTSNALILLKPTTTATSSSSSQIQVSNVSAIATIHDTIELVTEPIDKVVPVARGKWHEKFARGR
ncbi:hypothetical protein F5Y15DRAFT_191452 [Xylariaceae sp. FL0016]|nr:hypothetical protein F5Y15DRAFT_191452 [Xylariaceae sp. FL0016]